MAAIVKIGPTGSAPNITNQSGPSLGMMAMDGLPEHAITGIAGEDIAAGDCCYITSTLVGGQPQIKRCDTTGVAGNPDIKCTFRGVAPKRAFNTEAITIYAGVDIVYCAPGGLSPGSEVYTGATGTPGALDDAGVTHSVNVGYAKTDQIVHFYNAARTRANIAV